MTKFCFFMGILICGSLLGTFVGIFAGSPAAGICGGVIIAALYAAYRLGRRHLTGKIAMTSFFIGATAFGGMIGYVFGLLFTDSSVPGLVGLFVGALFAAFGLGSGSLSQESATGILSETADQSLPLGFFGTLNRILLCSAIGVVAAFVAHDAFPIKWNAVQSWAVANNFSGSAEIVSRTIEISFATTAAVYFVPAFVGCWWLLSMLRAATSRK